MKTSTMKQLSGALLVLLLAACNGVNNRGAVDNPAVTGTSTSTIEVSRVEISDTATVMHIKAFFRPKNWIRIASETVLRDRQGHDYPLRSADGIVPGEQFIMPESGEAQFTLHFAPVPSNCPSVDFIENEEDGAFKIFGIQLTGTPLQLDMPRGFTPAEADANLALPEVVQKAGKAQLQGWILNYNPAMGDELAVMVTYPFGDSEIEGVKVAPDGRFSAAIDAFSPHPVRVRFMNNIDLCFIAPDETTTIVLNPAESTRNKSRLRKESAPLGKPAYFGGYLASLSQEIADNRLWTKLSGRTYETEQDYYDFLDSFYNKTTDGAKANLLQELQAKEAAIDTLSYSPACKELFRMAAELQFTAELNRVKPYIINAYDRKNQSKENPKARSAYANSLKFTPNFYDPIKELTYINNPVRCYSLLNGRHGIMKEKYEVELGTDKGYLFEALDARDALHWIEERSDALDSAALAKVPALYRPYVTQKNEALLVKIKEIESKISQPVEEISPAMPGKDILPAIIAKQKGKPILIDFWATWCGPCKQANKDLAPVKEELKEKGIVYVYVTGETSPEGTWKMMIPDLHGIHYRLSNKQWEEVGKELGIRGIPTYFYINKEGKIHHKQVGYAGVAQMKKTLLEIAE
ncbi:MAG: TlpA family protein disulfide reductase [Prevotellaceae bacterium]|jgi:thiol-disulfide isomerase/thioredoxin|nr:TlpA family protein disulfide reductase [Prevotellaceae bacterium]